MQKEIKEGMTVVRRVHSSLRLGSLEPEFHNVLTIKNGLVRLQKIGVDPYVWILPEERLNIVYVQRFKHNDIREEFFVPYEDFSFEETKIFLALLSHLNIPFEGLLIPNEGGVAERKMLARAKRWTRLTLVATWVIVALSVFVFLLTQWL